jgi:hypothetical protein
MIRSCAVLLVLSVPLSSQDWYVSGTGLDSRAGTSPATAFLTLKKAAGLVNPGDTVWVMDGTYVNDWPTGDTVHLTRSGTAGAWISWKAMPGHTPVLRSNGWAGLRISANYQWIEGLVLRGYRADLTLAAAEADYENTSPSPVFNTTGVTTDARAKGAPDHHIVLRNLVVEDWPGGGIQFIQADQVVVEGCTVRGNAWYGRYAQSGISIYQSWSIPGYATAAYGNVVRGNILFKNQSLVKWKSLGRLSDGNGIIIDDNRNTQNGSTRGAYPYRTLVTNNLSVDNGGSGMHAYESDRVDFLHNTTYHNGTVVGYAELSAHDADDVRIEGNICIARPGGKVNSAPGVDDTVTYARNVYWGGTVAVLGTGSVVADPLVRTLSTSATAADFRLRPGSPAIDRAVWIAGATPAVDLAGVARPQMAGPDAGAYEIVNTAPTVTGVSASGPLVLP